MSNEASGPVVVVTGGAGFLGRVVVSQLLGEGAPLTPSEVRVFDRADHPHGDRVRTFKGDLREREDLRRAFRGADLVIHCAAAVDWGRESEEVLHAVNVLGTENVIAACRDEGVRALVHTSTLDVVYTGRPVVDGDESLPYPDRHPNAYCSTKAEGERRALAANDEQLRVAVIRPCCIFGEEDPYHVPPLLELAERGRLVRVGDGSSRSQFTYVGNVAHALILAGASLLSPESPAAGQLYFVTDCEGANFFDFVTPFVEAEGVKMPPAHRGLPRTPLYAIGALLEGAAWLVRPVFRFAPTLTRFAVDFVCMDFTIRTSKLAEDLGYEPRYPPAEAIERTIAWHRSRPR